MDASTVYKLTVLQAFLFCISCSIIYVGSLYIIVPRRVRLYPRDHHLQIQYRLLAVSIGTICSLYWFTMIVPTQAYLNVSPWQALGLYHSKAELTSEDNFLMHNSISIVPKTVIEYLYSIWITFLLMLIFYLGPIATAFHYSVICCYYQVDYDGSMKQHQRINNSLVIKFMKNLYIMNRDQFRNQSFWVLARALLIAPITEEVVFRAIMVPALYIGLLSTSVPQMISSDPLHSYYTPWTIAWLNPLFFGCAHIHHLYEKLQNGIEIKSALISTTIQFTYTSIFGFIATLLFLRTGNICCAIVSHMVCNYTGLPNLGFLYDSSSGDRNSYSCMYTWRHLHLGLHALGLVLFSIAILPLTNRFANSSIYWKPYL